MFQHYFAYKIYIWISRNWVFHQHIKLFIYWFFNFCITTISWQELAQMKTWLQMSFWSSLFCCFSVCFVGCFLASFLLHQVYKNKLMLQLCRAYLNKYTLMGLALHMCISQHVALYSWPHFVSKAVHFKWWLLLPWWYLSPRLSASHPAYLNVSVYSTSQASSCAAIAIAAEKGWKTSWQCRKARFDLISLVVEIFFLSSLYSIAGHINKSGACTWMTY